MPLRLARSVAVLALWLAAPLAAHDFWLEPSSFQPAASTKIFVRLRVGEHFQGDLVPRDGQRLRRFALLDAHGERAISGRDGDEPAGIVEVGGPGRAVVVYTNSPAYLQLAPEKFEAFLRLEGLESVLQERAKRGESASDSRELYSRCAKALLAVGATAAAGPADHPLGLRLELIAERDPYALPADRRLPVRLLWNGQPLAGALVVALAKGAPEAEQRLRTDAHGRAVVVVAARGVWLVKAVHMVRAPADTDPPADWESVWASLDFAAP